MPQFEVNWDANSNNMSYTSDVLSNDDKCYPLKQEKLSRCMMGFKCIGEHIMEQNPELVEKYKSHMAAINESIHGEEDIDFQDEKCDSLQAILESVSDKNYRTCIKNIFDHSLEDPKPRIFVAMIHGI